MFLKINNVKPKKNQKKGIYSIYVVYRVVFDFVDDL